MKKTLLLLSLGALLLPVPAAQAQACPPAGQRNSAAATRPLIVLDGFVLPYNVALGQLNPAQIVRVEVVKDLTPLGFSCSSPRAAVIVTSRIPWAVQGAQPRIYPTQKAAMRSIKGQQIEDVQLLTVAESARYGAGPDTQVMLVTLKEQARPRKPVTTPGKVQLPQGR